MNTSGTFSVPFLRKDLPSIIKILKAPPAFKVKLQEEENKYDLDTWTTANGSTQVQAAAEATLVFPLDVSSAFQTNIESNPPEQPDHPLKGTPADKLCIQALRYIQGSNDAGTYDNAILNWSYNNHKALLAISTDDFLMVTTYRSLYGKLKQ
eukprot:3090497-Ditylum_brightwellii.AAC.1